MKKALIGILIVVILGLGLVVGIFLVGQTQIFKQKASSPTGTATVSLTPSQGNFQVNSVNSISVNFNTKGILISGVAMRITFSNLSAKASNIAINQSLLSSGDWTCPVKTVSDSGPIEEVDISCANTNTAGYSTSTDTVLATFDFTPSSVPVVNPLTLSFDPIETKITQKSDASDIALTPTSTGSYTIIGSLATSPTPTSPVIVVSPTATATNQATYNPIPTPMLTPTPTGSTFSFPTATATTTSYVVPTPTSSSRPPIPVTGFDTPTIILGLGGILLVIIAGGILIL